MIVKEMELVNFRNIKEFKQEFSGGVYLITGENEVGKTTLINAITILLTGDRSSNLLTQGEEKGHAKIKIGEYQVEIRFTEKNPRGTLTITAENGMRSDNKSMLQDIFEYSDFDAHEFTSWSNTAEGRRKQVSLVKSLLSKENIAELEDIEGKIQAKKDTGTEVNASYTATKAGLSLYSHITNADVEKYTERQSLKELYEDKIMATETNTKIEEVQERAKKRKEDIEKFNQETKGQLYHMTSKIEELEDSLKALINDKKIYTKERENEYSELLDLDKQAEEWLKNAKPISINDIDLKINEVDNNNAKYEEVNSFKTAKKIFEQATEKKEEHKKELDKLLAKKEELIKTADIPIEGLTFTENGLLLNNIPFAPGEVSTSQEMEVAAKLMIAKNPTVKVFKISQGESLGEAKLKAIVEFAEKNGYQGFIENVSRGQSELMVENYKVI
jgi:DNA repair exonuclease SbcCD ATPase subunit